MGISERTRLPRPADRLPLGFTGLQVSPMCLGITGSPDTVIAAYEAGINFFFLTGDLHWPLYEHTRRGIEKLLKGNPARRREIVVAAVSYLDEPLFQALQFHEIVDSVPGLGHIDVMIAGAVANEASLFARYQSIERGRAMGHVGARAVGATFHQRPLAVVASYRAMFDISLIRYNTAHPGAKRDLLPFLPAVRREKVFNFKSLMSQVTPQQFAQMGLNGSCWLPEPTDYYRFVLSSPEIDGILCSPQTPEEVRGLVRALDKPPLTAEEQNYMTWLSSAVHRVPVLA